MIENIAELKRITRKPGGERANWMERNITWNISIYLTWALLHTSISADGVVLLSILCALSAGFCFAVGSPASFLAGALLLHLWYILDHVDGPVARYRKQLNVTGIFFDYMVHHIVNFSIALGLGSGCFRNSSKVSDLFWTMLFAVSITLFNVINDARAKAFFTQIVRQGRIFAVNPDRVHALPNSERKNLSVGAVARKLFSLLHKACEVHIMMNVILLTALSNIYMAELFGHDLFRLLVITYALVLTILFIIRMVKIITAKKIDAEFNSFFTIQDKS